MNDITNELHTRSTIMQEKNVPSTKQTEEKPTNNKISMPSKCYFCLRAVRSYSYLVETIYDIDLTTFEYTDDIIDEVSRGVICNRCKNYNTRALLIVLKDKIRMEDQSCIR